MIKYITITSILTLVLFSCQSYDVETPEFSVYTDKQIYKVGDSINFRLEGNPDVITFYSGENGKEYQYRNRTELEGGHLKLNFVSRVLWGSQENNLSIQASTDFAGIYDIPSVKEATWTDITDRFTLPNTTGAGADTPSGVADLTDLLETGKPIYLAYKYLGQPSTPTTQRTWRITMFNLVTSFESGQSLSIASLTNPGWRQVDVENSNNQWTLPGTQLQFAPSGATELSEDWAITLPLYPTKVSPDTGFGIKNYTQKIESYTYAFEKSGEYTITFVGTNATYEGTKTVIKELKIQIED